MNGWQGSEGGSLFHLIDRVPPDADGEFPRLEEPNSQDFRVIERQLGRGPQGVVFVACRCPHGRPRVILTLPFEVAKGPAPPLLWLTCPHLVREISRREGEGTTRRFKEALEPGGERAGDNPRFLEEEERFGKLQAALAAGCGPGLAARLEKKGIAGGRQGVVKCLHAHAAYRLASGRGIVGGWCLEQIDNGPGSCCERIPEACFT